MKRIFALMACTLLPGFSFAGALLSVDGTAAGLVGQRMLLDGVFVGTVGDTIVLPGEKHQLQIALKEGFYGNQTLSIRGAALDSTSVDSGDCIGQTNWQLKGWPAPSIQKHGDVFTLTLAAAHPIPKGQCATSPSSLKCTESAAIVDVSSKPAGAEIWMDGKSLGLTSAATVSVPYCIGTTPRKDVVLRMKGFANCAQSFRIAGAAQKYQVNCTLVAIPAAVR